jgi:hypothetical protein
MESMSPSGMFAVALLVQRGLWLQHAHAQLNLPHINIPYQLFEIVEMGAVVRANTLKSDNIAMQVLYSAQDASFFVCIILIALLLRV